MARQILDIGSNANDGTGDTLRAAMDKVNDNFIELYSVSIENTSTYPATTYRPSVATTTSILCLRERDR
jgi:hypothetical protein